MNAKEYMEWKNQLISTCPNANNLSGISWQVLTDSNLPKEAKSEFIVIATRIKDCLAEGDLAHCLVMMIKCRQ